MTLKKRFLALCVAFLAVLQGAAAASELYSYEQIAVGGVGLGASMSYVESIYGQPTDFQILPQQEGQSYEEAVCRYGRGQGLTVYYAVGDRRNVAISVETTKAELETPSGLLVGMSDALMVETYGTADEMMARDDSVVYKYQYRDQCLFITTRKGKVRSIRCSYREDYPIRWVLASSARE